jgi:hypothetical protein
VVTGAYDPNPNLDARAIAYTDSGGATAEIGLYYFFEIVGPAGSVPVDIAYRTYVLSTLYASAFSYLEINGTTVVNLQDLNGTTPASIASTYSFSADANLAIDVNMFVNANTGAKAGNNASAYLDPYIYIDQSFANASEYSIILSPWVGNSPSVVPEPTTWTMMLIGLAGLGYGTFRRTRRGQAELA